MCSFQTWGPSQRQLATWAETPSACVGLLTPAFPRVTETAKSTLGAGSDPAIVALRVSTLCPFRGGSVSVCSEASAKHLKSHPWPAPVAWAASATRFHARILKPAIKKTKPSHAKGQLQDIFVHSVCLPQAGMESRPLSDARV